MPILDESHDFMHPVEGDQAWSESYYFNCYDPDTDTGFYTRCGIRPNEGTMDIGLSFWLPGGGIAHLGNVREQKVMIDDDLDVGVVKYERLAPLKQWRITASGEGASVDGKVQLACDVTFDALTPAMGGDGQGKEAADGSSAQTRLSVGKGHLEQAGQWSGWIEVDGTRFTLGPAARGNRDNPASQANRSPVKAKIRSKARRPRPQPAGPPKAATLPTISPSPKVRCNCNLPPKPTAAASRPTRTATPRHSSSRKSPGSRSCRPRCGKRSRAKPAARRRADMRNDSAGTLKVWTN